ncbi:MAG: type III secretion system chaperone [Gammaproteobacteria bacterium]
MTVKVMNTLLEEFGNSISIEGLKLDDEARCNLQFDDVVLSIELGSDEKSAYIYSLLGTPPENNLEQFYAVLLYANYMFQSTAGATLSVDLNNGGVVMVRELPLDGLRLPEFEQVLEQFVNTTEQWMRSLQDIDIETTTGGDAAGPGNPAGAGQHSLRV